MARFEADELEDVSGPSSKQIINNGIQAGRRVFHADELEEPSSIGEAQTVSPIRAALKALKPPTTTEELSRTPLIPGQSLATEYAKILRSDPGIAPEAFRGLVHLPSKAETPLQAAHYSGFREAPPIAAALLAPAAAPEAFGSSALGKMGESATLSAMRGVGSAGKLTRLERGLIGLGGIGAKSVVPGALSGTVAGAQEMAGQTLSGKMPTESVPAALSSAASSGIPVAIGSLAGESIPAIAGAIRSEPALVEAGAGLMKVPTNIPESYGSAMLGKPGEVFSAKPLEQIGKEWDALLAKHGVRDFGTVTREASEGYVPPNSWFQKTVKSVADKIRNNEAITAQEAHDASKAASSIERMAGGKFPNQESWAATQSREFWNDKAAIENAADELMPGHAKLRADTYYSNANEYGKRILPTNKGGTTNILRPVMAAYSGHPGAMVAMSPAVVRGALRGAYAAEQSMPGIGRAVGSVIASQRGNRGTK